MLHLYFSGTPSRLEGIGLTELDREVRDRHARGYELIGGAEQVDLDILAGLPRERFRVILAVELQAQHVWYDRFAALAAVLNHFHSAGYDEE